MIPTFRRPEAVGTTIPAKATEPTPEPEQVDETGIGHTRRAELALALHQRWHGSHSLGDVACARRAGAFEDVEAIEPLILRWLNQREGGLDDRRASEMTA